MKQRLAISDSHEQRQTISNPEEVREESEQD